MLVRREGQHDAAGQHDGGYAAGAPLAAGVVAEEAPEEHAGHDTADLDIAGQVGNVVVVADLVRDVACRVRNLLERCDLSGSCGGGIE